MGLFDFLRAADINQGVDEWKSTPGAVLLDVRTEEEYREGHIPGSINVPLDEIDRVKDIIPVKETLLFVHCLSGARSSQAVQYLMDYGYTKVKNIGGISRYRGKVETEQ